MMPHIASSFISGGRDRRRPLGDRHPHRSRKEEGAPPQYGRGGQKGKDSDKVKCYPI